MKIAILLTSVGDFGNKKYYNTQEIGLGRELAKYADELIIYKVIDSKEVYSEEIIDNFKLIQLPLNHIGNHGMINVSALDQSIDVLIYFSDMQLAVPRVYHWCKKNDIKFIPYIGVVESHSNHNWVRFIVDVLFKRTLGVYKNSKCMVKTPYVEEKLRKKGVKNIVVAPVGLDISLLNVDYNKTPTKILKNKYDYKKRDKVILFVGRLTNEKQPLRMLEIFKLLYRKDNDYRLLMIGKGELKESILEYIVTHSLGEVVCLIDQIPNCDMWELYRIADTFVNLNEQEIFGMAILEAMYYECKVVALHAPGPDFIIENNISGYLVRSDNEAVDEIINNMELTECDIHSRVAEHFMWKNTGNKLVSLF